MLDLYKLVQRRPLCLSGRSVERHTYFSRAINLLASVQCVHESPSDGDMIKFHMVTEPVEVRSELCLTSTNPIRKRNIPRYEQT